MPILNDGDKVRESITIQRNGGTIRGERTVSDVPVYRVYMSSSGDFINESKTALNELFFTEEPKPAPQPAHRFKVGDRVVHGYYGEGVVEQVDDSRIPYLVKYEEFGKKWHTEAYLSPAPAPEPPKFYTGKVRCIGVKGEAATEGRTEINEPFYARVGKEYKFDEGGCSALRMCAVKSFQEIERSLEFGLWIEVKE